MSLNQQSDVSEVKVKTLQKALQVLECFSTTTPALGITQISQMLNMNKSNVHNIVSTFVDLGYMDRLDNGKYSIGLKMLEYSYVVNENLGYVRAIYDILNSISQEAGEVVSFGIPSGDKVMYLYTAHPLSRLKFLPYRESLGETAPLYCTGIGKAILSHFPEETWLSKIPNERQKYTEKTVCDIDLILQDLHRCKERGYATDDEERRLGLRCIGVPIFNASNQLIGGMSMSGPLAAMIGENFQHNLQILMEGAYRIKERLYK